MNRLLWLMIVGQLAALQLAAQEIDYSRLELAHTLKGHEATIRALAISPDGKTLASAGHDKTIRLWDVRSGKVNVALDGHKGIVRVLRFSPDGTTLASGAYGGDDDVVRLWDVAAGKQKAPLSATTTATRVLTFSPDGNTLAWDDKGKAIRLGDVSSGKETAALPNADVVREIVFSPDGQALASSFFHGRGLRVWKADGKEIGAVNGNFTTLGFSSDGKSLTSGEFRKITKWDVSGSNELTEVVTVKPEKVIAEPFPMARLSPDGKSLATVDKDLAVINLSGDVGIFGEQRCGLILMDVASGKERTLFETRGKENWFRLIEFSPDGKTVALQNSDYSYTLVDTARGEQRARLAVPDLERGSGYPNIAFAPDGKAVAISRGATIELWVMP